MIFKYSRLVLLFAAVLLSAAPCLACGPDAAWSLLLYENDILKGRPYCRAVPGDAFALPELSLRCSLSEVIQNKSAKLPIQQGLTLACEHGDIFFEDRAEYLHSKNPTHQAIILRIGKHTEDSKKPYILFVGCVQNANDEKTPLCNSLPKKER